MAEWVGIPKVSGITDHDSCPVTPDGLQAGIFQCLLCSVDAKMRCRAHLMEISFWDIGSSEILDSAPQAAAKAQALTLWDELDA